MKKLILGSFVAGMSFLLALGVCEVSLRLWNPQGLVPSRFSYDPDLGTAPRPNAQGRYSIPGVFTYTFSHDSRGFRTTVDPKSGITFPIEHEKILILGDSYTYGDGVSDEETFSSRLQQTLNAAGHHMEVLNAARSGTGTDYALNLFLKRGISLKPKLTLLFFVSNDFEDNEWGYYLGVKRNGELQHKDFSHSAYASFELLRRSVIYNWFLSWSHLANYAKTAFCNFTGESQGRTGFNSPALVVSYKGLSGGYTSETTWKTTMLLRQLDVHVRKEGGKLIVFFVTYLTDAERYRKDGTLGPVEMRFRAIASQLGLRWYSTTELFSRTPGPVQSLYLKDAGHHWNAAGHALAAEFIYEKIASFTK